MKYHVEDWAGNRMFPEKEFDTFDDGWAYVMANCPENDWQDIYVVKPGEEG